ncbi:polysaccharide pyruvyl transferase family protein [Acinetobacter pseudolwoffii]|uniref:polysaccharide pyruvyl transferase family protein n=1 Tax=Acinetobacter pseudolwoffii TaxID=2053287 RepID=UPI002576A5F0|nr:polysaccharide pyruvyl transferase family protein [Acinetobacter pseudolwoffii]MDM1344683.1 polysaccharide pyruvyl transferase family protein [Acinetobacter pseudolwoffii]
MFKKIFESEVLFTGYYGQLNTGDDAFVVVSDWGAKKYWNKTTNRFLARKNNLPVLDGVKGYPFSIPRTYNIQNKLLISNTDYLISAGGSTIHSELQKNNIKQLALNKKRNGTLLKIGAIGVSIGPFKSSKDEKSVIEYLKNIDFLAVRDQRSYDFVEQLNLPYQPVNAFDLAALLPSVYGERKKELRSSSKKTIGVSVCPVESILGFDKDKEKERNKKTIELLKALDEKENIHFKFFIINGNSKVGDLKLTKEVISRVQPKSYEIVEYSKNTYYIWTEISKCDFVISTRLHAAIFACFSNTPFILNEYHRKCSDFLDDVAVSQNYRLYNSEYEVDEKTNTIIGVLNNRSSYIPPENMEKMVRKSELNFLGIEI